MLGRKKYRSSLREVNMILGSSLFLKLIVFVTNQQRVEGKQIYEEENKNKLTGKNITQIQILLLLKNVLVEPV